MTLLLKSVSACLAGMLRHARNFDDVLWIDSDLRELVSDAQRSCHAFYRHLLRYLPQGDHSNVPLGGYRSRYCWLSCSGDFGYAERDQQWRRQRPQVIFAIEH